MPLTPLTPGNSPQFTATPNGSIPEGVVPTWTSSDTTNITITTDETGLIATVAIGADTPVPEDVTLTISATFPDGTTPSGSFSFTVGAATPPEATGFTITQTA